jgi:hypothetical protein
LIRDIPRERRVASTRDDDEATFRQGFHAAIVLAGVTGLFSYDA